MVGALPAGRTAIEQAVGVAARLRRPSRAGLAGSWTVLVEARSGACWRNVILSGNDPYGLTARLLAGSALRVAATDRSGVLAPVQAVGSDFLSASLGEAGVAIDTYDPN